MRCTKYGPWRTTTALAVALLAAAAVVAAPPDKAKDDEPAAKTDKDEDAYVQSLIQKIADSHPLIRDSARAALAAIGKPALPALEKAAKGDDETAKAAKELVAKINGDAKDDNRPGPGARRGPGFRGGPWWDGRWAGYRDGRYGRRGPGPGWDGRDGRRPGFPGFGPPPGPPGFFGPGFGPRGRENALKDLNLTDQQKEKLREALTAHREKVHQEMEKLHDDFLKSLKDVLDEDQLKKLEKALPKPPALPDVKKP